jgi:hypothetical protein
MSGEMRGQGRVERVGFWWNGGFFGQGQGDRERWKERDWGGLRRKSLIVKPRRMALRRVVLEGEPRAREMYVVKEASFRLEMGRAMGLMEKAVISGEKMGILCEVSGG